MKKTRKQNRRYLWVVQLVVLILIILALVAAFHIWKKSQVSNSEPQIPQEDGDIEVLFCQTSNCTLAALNFMDTADKYLYCALYDLDLKELINKLLEKSTNTDVKLYTDNANFINLSFERTDKIGPLMHNKFCVADDSRIFTGSFNPTSNDAYRNDNNMLIIKSDILAGNYKDEFLELYNREPARKVQNPIVKIGGTTIENYFCPEDNCADRISDAIYSAKKSIYFMEFSFTSEKIANAMAARFADGIEVKGVFERRNVDSDAKMQLLLNQGANVKMDGNKYNLHHKVIIIDSEIVITGSMNPSMNGDERNDENILIIHDKNIADLYTQEFLRVWNLG